MPLHLELFHGRENPRQEMDDWGEPGPIFECRDYVHTTYAQDIKLGGTEEQSGYLIIGDGGLVYYDGMWYGDWSVFSAESGATETGEFKSRLQRFDQSKARPPREEAEKPGLSVPADLGRVDWKSLRRQKSVLVTMSGSKTGLHKRAAFAGLIHLLDYVQDEAAKTLGKEAVFENLNEAGAIHRSF